MFNIDSPRGCFLVAVLIGVASFTLALLKSDTDMGTGLATILAIGVGYLAALIMNVVISMFKSDKKD